MNKKQVVVAYDFSEPSDVALHRAVELACRAPDHVLHFIGVLSHGDYHRAESVEERLVARIRAELVDQTMGHEVEFFVHARIGNAADEILRLAEDVGAEFIVIGSHGRTGVKRLLLGSVSEAVVRGARCAVIVARAREYADVQLDKVVAVDVKSPPRELPHRYTYSRAGTLSRSNDWPIS
jgi:universal stress protein A